MKREELKPLTTASRELSLTHEEVVKVVSDAVRELHSVENLSKKKDNPLLVKIGLLLIAFPDPTISDVVGGLLVSAGLIQTKIRRSTLHIEDVPRTFQEVIKSLQAVRGA